MPFNKVWLLVPFLIVLIVGTIWVLYPIRETFEFNTVNYVQKSLPPVYGPPNKQTSPLPITSLKVIANFFDVSNLMEDGIVSGATDSVEK